MFATHSRPIEGKNEGMLIQYSEFKRQEESSHIRYVTEKLAETEAVSDDPDAWISTDELSIEWGDGDSF